MSLLSYNEAVTRIYIAPMINYINVGAMYLRRTNIFYSIQLICLSVSVIAFWKGKRMRFVKKPPKTDKALSGRLQAAGWKKIREPASIGAAIACSIPFALLLGGLCLLLIYCLNPALFDFLHDGSFSITITLNLNTILYVLSIFVLMILHELFHAVFIPNFVKSQRTFWGINGLFGFVFTTEPIKKGRFILISVMPFVLLSVILPAALRLFSAFGSYPAFLCFINGVGSCVDFLNVCLIAFQVPGGHVIVSNGFETYHSDTVLHTA